MRPKAKPAAGNGGPREIQISSWKPHSKNTLLGCFIAALPSGLILHSAAANRFRDQVLDALDKHPPGARP